MNSFPVFLKNKRVPSYFEVGFLTSGKSGLTSSSSCPFSLFAFSISLLKLGFKPFYFQFISLFFSLFQVKNMNGSTVAADSQILRQRVKR